MQEGDVVQCCCDTCLENNITCVAVVLSSKEAEIYGGSAYDVFGRIIWSSSVIFKPGQVYEFNRARKLEEREAVAYRLME